MPDKDLDDNLLNLMIHRLEAQERTSSRLRDRGAMYIGFSFAIVGIFLGVMAAKSEPLTTPLVIGTWVMVVIFAAAFVTFIVIYRRADVWVLPDPRVLYQETDASRIPPSIIEAFEHNAPSNRKDEKLLLGLLTLIVGQMVCFLTVLVWDVV